jgi:hypothetical protein
MMTSSIGSSPEEIMLKKALRRRAQEAQPSARRASKAPSYITQYSSDDSEDEKEEVAEKVELTAEDAAQLAAEGIDVEEIDDYDDDYGEFIQYETKIAKSKSMEGTKKSFAIHSARLSVIEDDEEDCDSSLISADRDTLSPLRSDNKNPLNMSELGEFDALSSPTHSLNPVEVRKYFGEPARGRFNSRCHWIRKQCDISDIKSTSSPKKKNMMKTHRPLSKQGSLSPLKQKEATNRGSGSKFVLFSPVRNPLKQQRGSPSRSKSGSRAASRQQTANTMVMFDDRDDPDAEWYTSGDHLDMLGSSPFFIHDESASVPSPSPSSRTEDLSVSTDLSVPLLDVPGMLVDPSLPDETRRVFEALRAMTPDLYKPPGRGSGLTEPSSPRSAYIVGCVTHRLNPRASLVVRKKLTRELQLAHYGMVSI